MVFLQKPYDPRIDAGFMPGFLRPVLSAVSSGFPVCLGAPVFCRGVPGCFPALPGVLSVSRMAPGLVLLPGLLSNGS